jgi:hypothetical protein
MRGTLKLTLTAPVLVATVTLVACAGPERRLKDSYAGPVPPRLVLPGYKAEECHFVKEELPQEPPKDNGPMNVGMGGNATSLARHTEPNPQKPDPPVECAHTTTLDICRDDNGNDHPMSWCEERKRARTESRNPTTGIQGAGHSICSEPNG